MNTMKTDTLKCTVFYTFKLKCPSSLQDEFYVGKINDDGGDDEVCVKLIFHTCGIGRRW